MIVTAIKTDRISAGSISLQSLLDRAITHLENKSVVAITSKIVSLCENNVVPFENANIEELIEQESDFLYRVI